MQGVGCRAQIYDLIENIGHISGYVRNLRDGSVEVAVKGPDWRVNDIEEILRSKLHPPVKIERLLVEDLPEGLDLNGFVVRRDG